jgi:hypothetical protein
MTTPFNPYQTNLPDDVSFDRQLTKKLEEILEKELAHKLPEEKKLIIQVAKEMIKMDKDNFPHGLDAKALQNGEKRQLLVDTVVAAYCFERYLDAHIRLKGNCKSIYNEFKELKQNPQATPEEIQKLKDDFKSALAELNRLEPNPEMKRKNEEMLNDPDLLDKMIEADEKLEAKKERGPATTPQEKLDDEELEKTLINLFGITPTPGKIVGPVQAVLGDMMGIPDAYPAYSPNEPIHRLSEDLTDTGEDKHHEIADSLLENFCEVARVAKGLFSSEAEKEIDTAELDDSAFRASHEAARLTRE